MPGEWPAVAGWPDAAVAVAVARRLRNHAGWDRWQVHVEHGRVLLCDDFDDPVEQHVAALLTLAVPGVLAVDTVLRSVCPRHGILSRALLRPAPAAVSRSGHE